MSKALFRAMNRLHIFLYRRSGGSILGKIAGSPVLLLTTVGRKTGKQRTVPLVYTRDEQQYVVIASDQPGWYANLRSQPEARIEIKGQIFQVEARDAAEAETPALWGRFIFQSPAFTSFSKSPDHQLVVLRPLRE